VGVVFAISAITRRREMAALVERSIENRT
jgi:hypothetical protein